jgi:predicted acetyltransferase
VVSLDAVSARELNSFLLGFRQARHILFPHLAVDTPLRAMLKDPRTLRCTAVRDFLWMRILDVEAALPLRRYGTGATLVLDVRDVTLPENAGRYRLSHEAGGPVCGVTTQAADLSLDVADLAAAYLGGTSFTTLAAAGLVEEHTSGALTRADALFAADRQPWTVSDW